ncbi:methyltransferase family protein [Salimicrobium halophilum]|uniref:Protein-S-isoprenylcysteine O-methyltransferase Ste14 n=1 Tax=Salimicrobium halophilum TaxID=86666 RepID=A0A1G8VUG4_9BACI|nr:isoprenylcysteine carboxylmethyltransferase family protein [Salimicrobium halophilum]SDJ68850.1 Protein-S-isoprenylcysteine O-methyltransferase Ste14 [Salimicrobium halophilum]
MIEIVFGIISLVWIAEFLFFSSPASEKTERRSFWYIFLAILVSILFIMWLDPWTVMAPPVRWAGIVLYGLGVGLRLWGIIHLKEQFTRNVSVSEGSHLVSTGPYRVLRHPLYTGLLSITAGFALSNGSVAGFIIGMLAVGASLLYRIRLEEAMLVGQHGNMYVQWCKKRYRLIPFFY